jgi:hypothetical protein
MQEGNFNLRLSATRQHLPVPIDVISRFLRFKLRCIASFDVVYRFLTIVQVVLAWVVRAELFLLGEFQQYTTINSQSYSPTSACSCNSQLISLNTLFTELELIIETRNSVLLQVRFREPVWDSLNCLYTKWSELCPPQDPIANHTHTAINRLCRDFNPTT